ncbi:MAG: hypothetical protein O2840_00315 [bacterium]|nr:hypothetical protein [bacterium]
MKIKELLNALLENPNRKIAIRGKQKEIVGFAEFRSINLGDEGYFKAIFDDHSLLLIIPGEELLLYSDKAPEPFDEIADEDIGNKQELLFRGRRYKLENAHDYQYVVQLIKGNYQSIEGEVKYSDYVPEDGANELLSLGWIVRTGKRADDNPKELSIEDVKLS